MEGGGTERRQETSSANHQKGHRIQEETAFTSERQHSQGDKIPEVVKILYTNARSLLSKVDDLAILSDEYGPDIIIITETWNNKDVCNALLNISGYVIEPELRVDRRAQPME